MAMVYNFLTDETRPAQPGDRLYMRIGIVDNFMELYFNWHLVGSGLLDGPGVISWPGGAMGYLEEDGAIKGSADKMLFIRKMDAKIFSRTDKFVGFVCITGPPGGGKGTVIYTLRRFGGDGRPARQRATATSTRIAGSTRRP